MVPIVTIHHVQDTPADTWVVDHGQHGYPIVDVYTAQNGVVQKIMPLGVEYIDENIVHVKFSTARTGFATVII